MLERTKYELHDAPAADDVEWNEGSGDGWWWCSVDGCVIKFVLMKWVIILIHRNHSLSTTPCWKVWLVPLSIYLLSQNENLNFIRIFDWKINLINDKRYTSLRIHFHFLSQSQILSRGNFTLKDPGGGGLKTRFFTLGEICFTFCLEFWVHIFRSDLGEN